MKRNNITEFVWMILIATFLMNSSCALFGKKEGAQVYDKGKEGQWVYSTQKPSPSGDQKRATTYSKRPYAGSEGEEVAVAGTGTKPIVTPYLLGRLKYKVVIAKFQDNTKKGIRGLGDLVTQQLAKQLEESGAVVVVDIELVKKSLGGGEGSILSTPSSLWKLKSLLGVQGVVSGIIQDTLVGTGKQAKTEEAMALTKMDVLVLDTETGNVIRSIKGENPIYASRAVGELSEDKALLNAITFALQGVTDGIIRGLAGLEWCTSVASVEGDKLYLNAGKSSGLKVGDELEIYNPGKQVKHPVTGVSLGRLRGSLQGKVMVSQFLGLDAAETKIVSGGNITTGDEARLAK
jgi:hypothetical protein